MIPAPWKRSVWGIEGVDPKAGQRVICSMNSNYPEEPDASLIAAAPDLYEALKMLVAQIDDDSELTDYHFHQSVGLEKARQALGKVKCENHL